VPNALNGRAGFLRPAAAADKSEKGTLVGRLNEIVHRKKEIRLPGIDVAADCRATAVAAAQNLH
jgi:hypothetical protein